MASTLDTALTECPDCGEPLLIPVRGRQRGRTVVLAFDFAQVREHVATHDAPPITKELPPTAR